MCSILTTAAKIGRVNLRRELFVRALVNSSSRLSRQGTLPTTFWTPPRERLYGPANWPRFGAQDRLLSIRLDNQSVLPSPLTTSRRSRAMVPKTASTRTSTTRRRNWQSLISESAARSKRLVRWRRSSSQVAGSSETMLSQITVFLSCLGKTSSRFDQLI